MWSQVPNVNYGYGAYMLPAEDVLGYPFFQPECVAPPLMFWVTPNFPDLSFSAARAVEPLIELPLLGGLGINQHSSRVEEISGRQSNTLPAEDNGRIGTQLLDNANRRQNGRERATGSQSSHHTQIDYEEKTSSRQSRLKTACLVKPLGFIFTDFFLSIPNLKEVLPQSFQKVNAFVNCKPQPKDKKMIAEYSACTINFIRTASQQTLALLKVFMESEQFMDTIKKSYGFKWWAQDRVGLVRFYQEWVLQDRALLTPCRFYERVFSKRKE